MSFAWYLDITLNQMFSLYEYPISGKSGLPLCQEHGRQLELKEVVLYDQEATETFPPDHCWVCKESCVRMPLLYYWRPDNYYRDLDMCVGCHLNQANPLLHKIEIGGSP